MNRKLLFLTAFCTIIVFMACSEKPGSSQSFVDDQADIFTPGQEASLDSLLGLHEKRTTNEMVVHTTKDYGSQADINMYSLEYLRSKGIGKKDIDNGLVIVLNVQEGEVRIETGYGTEQVLKDEIAKRMIDSLMIPKFQNGEYYSGVFTAVQAITRFLEADSNRILPVDSKKSRGLR